MTGLIPGQPSLNGCPPRPGEPPNWAFSATDLTFAWEDCPRCFYHRIRDRMFPPRGPMPAIFSHIDARMKECFQDGRIERLVPALPAGVIAYAGEWVESVPLLLPGAKATVSLRGRFDTVVHFDDGTYAVIDYKTVEPRPEHVLLYSRQLHVYALAMERAAPSGKSYSPVVRLGLVAYTPKRFVHRPGAASGIEAFFGGALRWIEIPRDDAAFFAFLKKVVALLEEPEPPDPAPECAACAYRQMARKTGW